MTLTERLKAAIRDVADFPKPGILFKDITPILTDPILCKDVAQELYHLFADKKIDAIAGVESRGFLFGLMLAQHFNVPFISVRKSGKLPYKTISHQYALEYGHATVEMHIDAVNPGMRVLIHDDLLATGGTASAAAELVKKLGGEVAGFAFLIELSFLNGKKNLQVYSQDVKSLISFA